MRPSIAVLGLVAACRSVASPTPADGSDRPPVTQPTHVEAPAAAPPVGRVEPVPADGRAAEAAEPPPPPPKVAPSTGPTAAPAVGPRCGDRTCAVGESCVEYFGIAGPRGPAFRECAIRCRAGAPNQGCPPGTRCRHVADGPGAVCR